MNDFLRALERELNAPAGSLSPDTPLTGSRELDSMGVVLMMAFGESEFGKLTTGAQIRNCRTPAELFSLLGGVEEV